MHLLKDHGLMNTVRNLTSGSTLFRWALPPVTSRKLLFYRIALQTITWTALRPSSHQFVNVTFRKYIIKCQKDISGFGDDLIVPLFIKLLISISDPLSYFRSRHCYYDPIFDCLMVLDQLCYLLSNNYKQIFLKPPDIWHYSYNSISWEWVRGLLGATSLYREWPPVLLG